jgi:hypothetical protein
MKDGVYSVTTKYFVAGFTIKDGKIDQCAPILRKNILFWFKVAKRVEDLNESKKGE